jgi:hypothetical protein
MRRINKPLILQHNPKSYGSNDKKWTGRSGMRKRGAFESPTVLEGEQL